MKTKFYWNCIVRESNPGRPRGRRAFYHWTNDASRLQMVLMMLCLSFCYSSLWFSSITQVWKDQCTVCGYWLDGLGVWFSLRVREVPGSNPGQAHLTFLEFFLVIIIKKRLWDPTLTQKISWRCRGLNPRPSACEADALPLSYIPMYHKLLQAFALNERTWFVQKFMLQVRLELTTPAFLKYCL